jgi:hypothetical protein
MSHRQAATSHMLVQRVGWPIHINPLMGRLSRQVKLLCEATSPIIVSDIIHLSVMNARELKRTPGRYKEDSGTDGNAMEAPNQTL